MPEFNVDEANKYAQEITQMLRDSNIPCTPEALLACLIVAYTAFGTMTEGQSGQTGPAHFKNPATLTSFMELVGVLVADIIPSSHVMSVEQPN
jgi:hypothetical protein